MTESKLIRQVPPWVRRFTISIICILALSGCSGTAQSASEVDDVLAVAADVVNRQAPMMVDAETRLDNAAALPGKTFAYNYTLVNYSRADLTQEDVSAAEASFAPVLLNKIRSSSEMKELRDYGTTFKYIYRSSDGYELIAITLSPNDYNS